MSQLNSAPGRLAVVGAGLGSAPHFRSLRDLAAEVDLGWVVGRDLPRLQAAGLPPSTRLTTRLAEALDDASVQAQFIYGSGVMVGTAQGTGGGADPPAN